MPFIPHTADDIRTMLAAIGAPDIDALFEEIPAETIARHRVSREGQDGMRAFLDKRPAPWTPDGE